MKRKTDHIVKLIVLDRAWLAYVEARDERIPDVTRIAKLGLSAYQKHGAPFGDGGKAAFTWLMFGERTAKN